MTKAEHAKILAVLEDIHAQIVGLPVHVEPSLDGVQRTSYVRRATVLDIIEAEILRLAPKVQP